MNTKRYRFTVEYEGPHEWNVGVTPGADAGEKTTSHELVTVLRSIADRMEESFAPDKEVSQVVYPPFGGGA